MNVLHICLTNGNKAVLHSYKLYKLPTVCSISQHSCQTMLHLVTPRMKTVFMCFEVWFLLWGWWCHFKGSQVFVLSVTSPLSYSEYPPGLDVALNLILGCRVDAASWMSVVFVTHHAELLTYIAKSDSQTIWELNLGLHLVSVLLEYFL